MIQRRARVLAVWVLCVAAALVVVARARYVTDLSAFLPGNPTPVQQLLVDQLRDGPASRLILIALEQGDARTRAALAAGLAGRLRRDDTFSSVDDGEPLNAERDHEFLFEHRYLLSDGVTAERFSTAGFTGVDQRYHRRSRLVHGSAAQVLGAARPHRRNRPGDRSPGARPGAAHRRRRLGVGGRHAHAVGGANRGRRLGHRRPGAGPRCHSQRIRGLRRAECRARGIAPERPQRLRGPGARHHRARRHGFVARQQPAHHRVVARRVPLRRRPRPGTAAGGDRRRVRRRRRRAGIRRGAWHLPGLRRHVDRGVRGLFDLFLHPVTAGRR